MKKLFTTLILMGVALCGWATITESSDGTTVTLNYVDDGNQSDQNFNLSNKNATKIVLTGDWANKDLQRLGNIVGQCNGNVFLDMSACEGFRSTIGNNPVDWTSNNLTFLPNSSTTETVHRTGTATPSYKYYYMYALDGTGQPASWASPYTGDVIEDGGNYYENNNGQKGNQLKRFDIYVDENGKEVPSNSVTPNPDDGTYSYDFNETLDNTPFSFAGNDFSNNAKKLSGIAFPNSTNFTAIPDKLFGDDGAPTIDINGQKISPLDSISLGSNIIYIGGYAFKNSQVEYVDFPAGLKAIGPEAFDSAPLKKVDLSGCTSLEAIKYEAFEFCSQLKTLIFPEGDTFTFLGNDAFKQIAIETLDMSMCEGITEFQASEGKHKTFYQCRDLKTVILPPNLTAVPDDTGNGVFNGCTAMDSLVFTGHGVYEDCVLQNPLYIGKNAFNFGQVHGTGENQTVDLSSLRSITLSNNVSFIEFQAFYAAAITEIHIPASVDSLAKHCFYGCQNLKVVVFDAFDPTCGDCLGAETKVAGEQGSGGQGQGAFEECQHITDVFMNTMAEINCTNNAFDQDISWGAGDTGANFATLHFPREKTEHYVNLQHYLTDAIVASPGKFHDWLEDHYKQAIVPHKNGWYEFINSGPTDPNDSTVYQSIILRTFSDYDYAYLVPQGLRAYVVNKVEPVGNNYEVTLMRINVIPKRTGVILYGHPNGRTQAGDPTLVLTPVKFLETGDPLFDQKYNAAGELIDCDIEYNTDGTMKQQDTYRGPDQGAALCRANWDNLTDVRYKNYLEPILSADGSRVPIQPYEYMKKDGKKLIKYRNFALGRYTATDYYSDDNSTLNDETNYVGFFRMKRQNYKSGYAYLRLAGDVDEDGNSLTTYDEETGEVISTLSEFAVSDGGEILVKKDEPAVNDEANGIYPYYWEVMIKGGIPYDARDKMGDPDWNPKRWWDEEATPVAFTWEEYTQSWGSRDDALVDPSAVLKYFGELEDDVDGVVKVVIPARNENDAYYTLQGVRVDNPTAKGVYIHNGKKVIIK